MTKEELIDKLVEGGKLMPYMERFEAEEVVNFILNNYSLPEEPVSNMSNIDREDNRLGGI